VWYNRPVAKWYMKIRNECIDVGLHKEIYLIDSQSLQSKHCAFVPYAHIFCFVKLFSGLNTFFGCCGILLTPLCLAVFNVKYWIISLWKYLLFSLASWPPSCRCARP
jgi:hypothetical protein